MRATLQLLEFWALAFVTLGVAVVLLNIFYGLIGNDLTLHSIGKEAAIAATASLVEGASVWLVLAFIPAAGRALIVPALIVGLIYKLSHLEDWSRYDVLLLLGFQMAIGGFAVSLLIGHFATAFTILFVFAAALVIYGSFAKSFWD